MRRPRSTDARCDDTIIHNSDGKRHRDDLQTGVRKGVIAHHFSSALSRVLRSFGVERPLDLAVQRNADAARLFGNDDRNRIVLFGQADRRAMARAEVPRELRVDRQRQKARRRGHAIVLHDDRAVVQRRLRLKDAHEQIVGEHGVERKPRLDVVPQADLPLDDDDRADALRPRAASPRRRFPRWSPRRLPASGNSGRTARGRNARARGGCPPETARWRQRRDTAADCGSASRPSADAPSARRRTSTRAAPNPAAIWMARVPRIAFSTS